MKPIKNPNPIFAIAAENYKHDVLSLRKLPSYKSYTRHIDKLIEYFGHVRIDDIGKQDIQKYIVKVSQQSGVETMRHHLIAFKGIMEYADESWEMPTRLKKPKKPRPKQEFYTFEEVRKMLQHSSGSLKVLIMLLAETGLRLGEALALQPGDVLNGTISVTKNVYEGYLQDTPKTESSIRKLCISKTLEKELKPFITSDPNRFLFRTPTGRPLWPQQLVYELRVVCSNAGVKYKAIHSFRRGNITELCNSLGIPERTVGMRVGHGSLGMTLGVYNQAMVGTDQIWVPVIEKYLYEGKGGFEDYFKRIFDKSTEL